MYKLSRLCKFFYDAFRVIVMNISIAIQLRPHAGSLFSELSLFVCLFMEIFAATAAFSTLSKFHRAMFFSNPVLMNLDNSSQRYFCNEGQLIAGGEVCYGVPFLT